MNQLSSIKKTLVFHFYIPSNYQDNEIIQLHLRCLANISSTIDKAIFIISVDESLDEMSITDFKCKLIKLGFNDIELKVKRHTVLGESLTYREEVIECIDKFKGLVFFGSSKGVEDAEVFYGYENDVKKWICMLYYGCFRDIAGVESALLNDGFCAYGSNKIGINCSFISMDYSWQYYGGFYWINSVLLSANYKETIPNIADKSYVESWISQVIPFHQSLSLGNRYILASISPIGDVDKLVSRIIPENLFDDFNHFAQKMIEEEKND